jgi:glycerol-3-phosphate dehydrogenase (NAD(P)+)
MYDFVVLGGGAMGTSIAYLLSNSGRRNVLIWMRNLEKAAVINETHHNSEYLMGITLPENLVATSDLFWALKQSENIVIAVPSNAVHSLLVQMNGRFNQKIRILSVVKGLDMNSGNRISSLVGGDLGIPNSNIAVLSGPNFAAELAERTPSVMVIASVNRDIVSFFKDSLESEHLHIFSSDDVAGVEISAIFKNILAISMGIVDGLGFGANTRGAIFPLCIFEALEIGTKVFGAKPETLLGPACLGDAVTTAFSSKSRNYLLGLLLAKKVSSNSENSFLSEGKNNIKLIRNLAFKNGISAPVTEFVYNIIDGENSYKAFSSLWKNLNSLPCKDLSCIK